MLPTYVTPGMLEQVKRFAVAALDHTYTRVPVVAVTDGLGDPVLDDWGQPKLTDGAPIPGLPCKLVYVETVSRDERGVVLVRRPLLWITIDDQLAQGDRVVDVANHDGLVVLAAAAVERSEISPDRFGGVTRVAELAGAEVVTPASPGGP